jgi:acetyl esterase/lipase
VDPRDVLTRPARRPDFTVWYDDHADALIDVFLPPDARVAPLPLLVVLHGGFWRQEWDRTHLRALAESLAGEGFVVATPEYRRTGGAGGWPQTGEDVDNGLRAVRGLIDHVAAGRVDPDAPFVLAGHSAGGHLAMWAGLRARADTVERIVALAPVSDLIGAARLGLDDGAAQDLLGGDPDAVPEAYAAAGLDGLLPGDVPVTIVHGDDDDRVPVSMSRYLAESVASTGTKAGFRYDELPGVDHFALIDPFSDAWPTVLRALLAS